MKEISVLFLLILFFSCSNDVEENQMNVEILAVNNTGCLTSKSTSIINDNEVYIVEATGENEFRIEHQHVFFNCCLPEGFEITTYFKNDTLFYSDDEKVAGNCKCTCPYNTSSEISGLENGDYVLCFISGGKYVGSIELLFNDSMYEEITVLELK